jgi:hypothetical protein
MNFLNNILDNDYVFFPLWVGVTGFLGYAWWSESTRVFGSITKTQLNEKTTTLNFINKDSISSTSDTIRDGINSNTSTVVQDDFTRVISYNYRTVSFEEKIQSFIQRDLERSHSSFNQNIN